MAKYSVIILGEVIIDAEDADQAEENLRLAIADLRLNVAGYQAQVKKDIIECLEVSGSDIVGEDEIAANLCPRCRKNEIGDRPALSRKDNKTEICSSCGTEEALEGVIS